jgi:hypothetical protein
MQITEFVPSPAFPLAVAFPLVISVLFLGGFAAITMRKRYLKNNISISAYYGGRSNVVFMIVGMTLSLICATAGGYVTDNVQDARARFAHYDAQAEAVMSSYPELKAAGIKLVYDTSYIYVPSYLMAAVENQGSIVPLGSGYERNGAGVGKSSYVMILNADWMLEIFSTAEDEQLVKVEPSAP